MPFAKTDHYSQRNIKFSSAVFILWTGTNHFLNIRKHNVKFNVCPLSNIFIIRMTIKLQFVSNKINKINVLSLKFNG